MTAFTQAMNSALLHFMWQGAAVALVLWIGLLLLRRRSAQARYLACCAALALMALAPAVTALVAYDRPAPAAIPIAVAASAVSAASQAAASAVHLPQAWLAIFQAWALPVWSLGVLLLSIRLVWGGRQVSQMRRRGTSDESLRAQVEVLGKRLGLTRPVRVLIAAAGQSPSVLGWLRPVVLVPSAALLSLSAEQLEAVLAHELAHIRRQDYLINLLQLLAETLLFYHPAVWWVSGRMRQERELCCDDLAVRCCGDAVCYARALTSLERLRVTAPALAMGSNGGSMLYRIQRLLGAGTQDYGPSKLPAILALALAVACFGVNIHGARGQQVRTFRADPSDDAGISVDTGGAALARRTPIEYPGWALEHGIDGTVTAELTLNADAAVIDARIASGAPELRKYVLQSVLNWRFTQPYANATLQIGVQFDKKAAAASPRQERDVTSVTVGRKWVTPGQPIPEQQAMQAKRAAEELQAQMAASGYAQAREDLARNQQAYATIGDTVRTNEWRSTNLTAEFLQEELAKAEAAYAKGTESQAAQDQIRELRSRLEAAQAAQELVRAETEPTIEGRKLRSIRFVGQIDASVMPRLGMRIGDVLTPQSMEAVTAAVKNFDPRLRVEFTAAGRRQAELQIIAPENQ